MTDFLLFQLYGPLASWGDIAVGEQRPTTQQPSKSAILGLLAAALGIRRDEEEKQQKLALGYGFAARVDGAGVMLRDYHTTQRIDSTARLKHLHTRRDELADTDNLGTILSSRDYRCDGFYTACLWTHEHPPYALPELREALEKPKFALYLGRKSCPPALPMRARVVAAKTLSAAFAAFTASQSEAERAWLQQLGVEKLRGGREVYWDKVSDSGTLELLHTTPRNDAPLSRRRWQFGKRNEQYGQIKGD